MAIDFDRFRHWVEQRFPHAVVKGKEIRLHSIFAADTNFHLWCSPSGGKKNRENGVFHCFKTDTKGSLINLVMKVDGLDYDDAVSLLKGEPTIRELERQVEEMLAEYDKPFLANKPKVRLALPEDCYQIEGLETWWGKKSREYLDGRKIPSEGLYICTGGRYKARIIIPYRDKEGTLIYWNGRHIGKAKAKYLGPDKEVGVGKEDVVFLTHWPEPGATIHLCEGEFNAKVMTLCGFNGGACGGKNMSEKQAAALKDYKLVICLDRDKAGERGTEVMAEKVTSIGMRLGKDRLRLTQPAEGFNDWNDMYLKFGSRILSEYVRRSETTLDSECPFGVVSFSARLKQ